MKKRYNIDDLREYKNKQHLYSVNTDYCNTGCETRLPYANGEICSEREGNDIIISLIKSGKPFSTGRLGETELRTIIYGLTNDFPILNPLKKRHCWNWECANFCEGAGFFPRKTGLIPRYVQTMIDAATEIDVAEAWYLPYEDFFIEKYMPSAKIIRMSSVDNFVSDNPWTYALEGKKVLVISPFEESIKRQYEKREKLFSDPRILPEFDLKTIKSVQPQKITGVKSKYDTWFDALDGMFNETLKIDYDIAILGCGAYGFPLSAMIKKSGHMSVHMCGETQLLFGIKGNRWDNSVWSKEYYNEYWMHPIKEECPTNRTLVENGCYW